MVVIGFLRLSDFAEVKELELKKNMSHFRVMVGLRQEFGCYSVTKRSECRLSPDFFFEESIKSMVWLPDVVDNCGTNSQVPVCLASPRFIRL